MVRGERALLRRALRNLIGNAQRYGGEVPPEVRVRPGDRASPGVIGPRPRSGHPRGRAGADFRAVLRLAGSAETGRGSGLGPGAGRQDRPPSWRTVACTAAPGGGSLFTITCRPSTAAAEHLEQMHLSLRRGLA